MSIVTEDEFLAALADGKWHTTRQLATTLNVTFTSDELGDTTRRMDNFIHGWRIFTSGQIMQGPQGYILTASANTEEVTTVINNLLLEANRRNHLADNIRSNATPPPPPPPP